MKIYTSVSGVYFECFLLAREGLNNRGRGYETAAR